MKISKQYIIIFAITIVTAVVSFYSGRRYQMTHSPQGQFDRKTSGQFMGSQNTNRAGSGRGAAGMMAMRPLVGEIISQDGKTLTIKLTDESSKLVILSDQSKISKAIVGERTDLTSGQQATIFGIQNSDGSITAQTILIGVTPSDMNGATATESSTFRKK